jgi:uncharacterized membrane protein
MDKFIVAVLPNEAAAYSVRAALEDLDTQGSIELYATEVIAKKADGQLVRVTSTEERGLGTIVGTSVGGLLGLLGGPVGLVVGAVAGGASGFATETAYSGVTGEFIANVGRSIAPGSYAVFAEAWEDWTFPVDDVVQNAGGRVVRQPIGDVVRAQMKAENDAGREEVAQLEAAIATSQGDSKAKLEAKRDEAKARHAERAAQLKQKSDDIQKNWDAKIASVQQKADKSSSDAKRRHQAIAQKLSSFVSQEKAALKQMFS